jgi:hypothetical protein
MVAPEHFQRVARRTRATLFHVFEALADAFVCICLRGDIQKALIGFGFPVGGESERFFLLLGMLHDLFRMAPEPRHALERQPKNSEHPSPEERGGINSLY